MRIAICEDVPADRERLQAMLTKYLLTHGFAAEVDCFTSGEALLAAFVPGKYPIIFMDIFLAPAGLTGMETAERIREKDEEAAIILTTSSRDFGIVGYSVAVYYIVKPVTSEDFARAMQKCHKQMERFGRAIEITVNRQSLSLQLHRIYYVEAQQRSCIFVTAQGEYRTNVPFKELAKQLSELPFLQCHRSYIVNLAHVQDLRQRDFILTDNRQIPISRQTLAEAQRQFNLFLRDELRGDLR